MRGRVVLLTGASRGIGLAVARSLVAHGAAVVVNGRDPEAVAAAVDELRALAGPAAAGVAAAGVTVAAGVAGSAADPVTVAEMLEQGRALGPVSALVTCAGAAEPPGSSILDIEVGQWRDLIDAHLTSTFVACRGVAPELKRNGGGAIVTTSSHAFTGAFGGTGYAAGKGGVNSLTYALAAELAEHGIRVNAVCPGARTRLSEGAGFENQIESLRRRGLLDDLMADGALNAPPAGYVAALYTFLASDLAAGITGEVFAGAGGYVGRFGRPAEELLLYRDHGTDPPWTLPELAAKLNPAPPPDLPPPPA